MAYMNQDKKKKIEPAVKSICKEYGIKATMSVRHHSTLCLNISSGPIDFIESYNRLGELRSFRQPSFNKSTGHIQVNTHGYITEHFDGKALEFLSKVIEAMYVGNHDNSDPMTDYFEVGWYVDVNVGQWDKPYQFNAPDTTPAPTRPPTTISFEEAFPNSLVQTEIVYIAHTKHEDVEMTKRFVAATITNDENSTDAEMEEYFQSTGFSPATAKYFVSRRGIVEQYPCGISL